MNYILPNDPSQRRDPENQALVQELCVVRAVVRLVGHLMLGIVRYQVEI